MRWYSVWYNWYLHLIVSIFITILITCGVVINLAKPGKEGKKGIGLGWSFAISWLLSTLACLMVHLIAYYERRRVSSPTGKKPAVKREGSLTMVGEGLGSTAA